MKSLLLAINHAYLFFGTTIYVDVLWALHFFWYPSWQVMNRGSVQDHFLLPIGKATEFFWVVVPLMFVANAIMIYTERKSPQRWLAVIAAARMDAAELFKDGHHDTHVAYAHVLLHKERKSAPGSLRATGRLGGRVL